MVSDLSKSIIYQIYLRTFTAEGTLKAAEAMLPHLHELGIDIIYMSACNTEDISVEGQSKRQKASGMNNPKNPYRIIDYFSVDEEYGTLEDLQDFIKTAHNYGMKVLIDLVFFHCGANAVFLKEHPEFVLRDKNGNVLIGNVWPFAVLDYENCELREYMWSIMEFYVKDMHADGFRCDVGNSIPLDFWAEGIQRIRRINPDVIMLNEGSNSAYLSEFDINYNMPTIYGLNNLFLDTNVLADGRQIEGREPITIDGIKELFDRIYSEIPDGKYILLNSENHDTVTDLKERRPEISLGTDAAEAMLTLLFTLKGIPMIYNGCEVADCTIQNMFWNRFCSGSMSVQWQNALCEKGRERLQFIKELIRIHRYNECICYGELEWCDDIVCENILAFRRKKDSNRIAVIVNVGCSVKNVVIPKEIKENVILAKNIIVNNSDVYFGSYGIMIAKI